MVVYSRKTKDVKTDHDVLTLEDEYSTRRQHQRRRDDLRLKVRLDNGYVKKNWPATTPSDDTSGDPVTCGEMNGSMIRMTRSSRPVTVASCDDGVKKTACRNRFTPALPHGSNVEITDWLIRNNGSGGDGDGERRRWLLFLGYVSLFTFSSLSPFYFFSLSLSTGSSLTDFSRLSLTKKKRWPLIVK